MFRWSFFVVLLALAAGEVDPAGGKKDSDNKHLVTYNYPIGADLDCQHGEMGAHIIVAPPEQPWNATAVQFDAERKHFFWLATMTDGTYIFKTVTPLMNIRANQSALPIVVAPGAMVNEEPVHSFAVEGTDGRVFIPICDGSPRGIKMYDNWLDAATWRLWGKEAKDERGGAIWSKPEHPSYIGAVVIDEKQEYLYAVNCGDFPYIYKFRLDDETLVAKFEKPIAPGRKLENIMLATPNTLYVMYDKGWFELSRNDGEKVRQDKDHRGFTAGDDKNGMFQALRNDDGEGFIFYKAPDTDSFVTVAGCANVTDPFDSRGYFATHASFETIMDGQDLYAYVGGPGSIRAWKVDTTFQLGRRYITEYYGQSQVPILRKKVPPPSECSSWEERNKFLEERMQAVLHLSQEMGTGKVNLPQAANRMRDIADSALAAWHQR